MPPKKATSAGPKKASGAGSHASYKDMITEAILNLKERNGSSRQSIKKYVRANNDINTTEAQFISLINRAINAGVEHGDFSWPKGPSGPVKIAKKTKPAAKPAAPKKSTTTKPAAPKKAAAAPKKEKATTTKKAAAPKKAAAAKPKATKANAAKPRKPSAAAAPAVVDKPTVLTKTKSGRVAKSTAKSDAPKKAAPKKTATKKATPKKKTSEAAATT